MTTTAPTRQPGRARRTRRRVLVAVGLAAVLVVVLALAGLLVARAQQLGPFRPGAQQENPFAVRPQYADPASRAAQAAARARADGDSADATVFERLARVPAGIWLTPEELPPGRVGPYVSSVVRAADAVEHVPLFVVYGIPDRDCSGRYSAGGLAVGQYVSWVQEIAAAAGAGDRAAVVLEPDALADALQCDDRDQRVRLLRAAVDRLRGAGVTTYVDAGHSDWVSARALTGLLRAVGTGSVRGFATNVANFQTDADERAYARRISAGLGGAHYVIDSGRNGKGSTRVWCNPVGRALGTDPGFVDDGTPLDAYLWIKPPGESDGSCGGGPPAGDFWPQRALELARAAGW